MTHAPYYDLFITAETLLPEYEKGLFRCIEATKILGAEICAVHPRTAFFGGEAHGDLLTCVDVEKSLQCNLESLSPLAKEAEKQGVLLGVENLMQYPNCPIPFYSCFEKDHIELIDKLQSDNVCAIWDFGHANLGNPNQASTIRALGGRIKGTHVHNNDGIQDEHFPPFIPSSSAHYIRRTVDWRKALPALKESGFSGYLTLEPSWDYSYPVAPYVRYLYESVSILDDILQGE
jgi:sugar phosphate isomerase/epimerase